MIIWSKTDSSMTDLLIHTGFHPSEESSPVERAVRGAAPDMVSRNTSFRCFQSDIAQKYIRKYFMYGVSIRSIDEMPRPIARKPECVEHVRSPVDVHAVTGLPAVLGKDLLFWDKVCCFVTMNKKHRPANLFRNRSTVNPSI